MEEIVKPHAVSAKHSKRVDECSAVDVEQRNSSGAMRMEHRDSTGAMHVEHRHSTGHIHVHYWPGVRSAAKRTRGIHTAVVLEPEVRERLKASEKGVSLEIRERINRTLWEEEAAPPTRELAVAVRQMAEEISRQTCTPWHSTMKGRRAIVAAIQHFLDSLPAPTAAAEEMFGPDDPSTLGRVIARMYLQSPPTTPGHPFYEETTTPREES
jgi:hypothetical protein